MSEAVAADHADEPTTEVRPGQTWLMDESRADDPDHDWPDNPFGSRLPSFHAVVDETDRDYVALSVTRRNRHVAAPDPGDEISKSAAKLREDDRWQLERDLDG